MEGFNIVLYLYDMFYDVQPMSQSTVISLIKMSVKVHDKKVIIIILNNI